MWYKNIVSRFFELVTKHACDRQTDGRTELRLQDRASVAPRAVIIILRKPAVIDELPQTKIYLTSE